MHGHGSRRSRGQSRRGNARRRRPRRHRRGLKKGAPKPEISTADAVKRTLLNAKSVSHSAEGASGVYLQNCQAARTPRRSVSQTLRKFRAYQGENREFHEKWQARCRTTVVRPHFNSLQPSSRPPRFAAIAVERQIEFFAPSRNVSRCDTSFGGTTDTVFARSQRISEIAQSENAYARISGRRPRLLHIDEARSPLHRDGHQSGMSARMFQYTTCQDTRAQPPPCLGWALSSSAAFIWVRVCSIR